MFERLMMASELTTAPVANGSFVEDVFSTYLYTGTGIGTTQTINNGIDLAGKGGMVWLKSRTESADHRILDTNRGAGNVICSNLSIAQVNESGSITSFGATGFSLGSNNGTNTSGQNYSSWTFRKAPKFFDVVTYTGNGTADRQIPHSIGAVPGCIIIKRTDGAKEWAVWHKNYTGPGLYLNSSIVYPGDTPQLATTQSATNIILSSFPTLLNASGASYVAYVFAHDPAADGMIQCGTFNTDASFNATVNLGWEPQWLLIKDVTGSLEWNIYDTMRGLSLNSFSALKPDTSGSEFVSTGGGLFPTATGFVNTNANSQSPLPASRTYIYIAIRRPMKTPTIGTSVFSPVAATQALNTTTPAISSVTTDLFISSGRDTSAVQFNVGDRLRGPPRLIAQQTTNESATSYLWDRQNGVAFSLNLTSSGPLIMYHFKRAPRFFDIVCYTGTNSNQMVSHNLGVIPELVIIKSRSAAYNWVVGHTDLGFSANQGLNLNTSDAKGADSPIQSATATQVQLLSGQAQQSGGTHVAYLFASCPGVSKVGSYTGNGTSQTINCGFTNGARFILIKRTDSTGDWYVWDTTRGIITGNDPHLSLNTTAAEVTTNDSVDPDSTGFIVNQVAATNINVTSATYIYLAIS